MLQSYNGIQRSNLAVSAGTAFSPCWNFQRCDCPKTKFRKSVSEAQKTSSATETWLKILTSWCCIKPYPYLATSTHLHYVITLPRHLPHVSGYFRKRRFFPPYLKKSASTRTVLCYCSYLWLKTPFPCGREVQTEKKSPFSKISGFVWTGLKDIAGQTCMAQEISEVRNSKFRQVDNLSSSFFLLSCRWVFWY